MQTISFQKILLLSVFLEKFTSTNQKSDQSSASKHSTGIGRSCGSYRGAFLKLNGPVHRSSYWDDV